MAPEEEILEAPPPEPELLKLEDEEEIEDDRAFTPNKQLPVNMEAAFNSLATVW